MSVKKQSSDDLSPLANAYLLAGFLALVSFGLVLVNTAGRLAIVPTLIGAAGLAFRWRTGPLLFLASVAACLILLSWYPVGAGYSREPPKLPGLGLSLAALAYVVAQYRLLGLTVSVFPPDPRPGDPPPPRTSSGGTNELVAAFVTVMVVTAAATFLWTASEKVPAPWAGNDAHWPLHWRLGLLAWAFLGGLAVAAAVIGHLGWRRLSRAEACMFLQDGLWHETRREQRRINRWRAWALRRR
jgi:hypothetical protein